MVEVLNPELASHGWESPHTVVRIVTDDMPFLVDSVRMAIHAAGLGIHLVVHPMLDAQRDGEQLVGFGEGRPTEAWMHLEVDRCGADRRAELERRLRDALDDVRVSVHDWEAMRSRADELAHELETRPQPVGTGEAARTAELLRWLSNDHFTFLGYREYHLEVDAEGEVAMVADVDSGLGLLRAGRRSVEPHRLAAMAPEARLRMRERSLLVVTTANSRSTVHRPDYLAYVAVRRYGDEGQVVGERRFLGLFPDMVQRESVLDIPAVREKALTVIDRAGFPADSHNGRALRMILEGFPRDELFQVGEDELYRLATGILGLQDRRQVRLFSRRDAYGRFVSCLVYLPRDRFSTVRATAIAAALEEAFGGFGTEHEVNVGTGALARLHVRVHVPPDAPREVSLGTVERRLAAIVRDWSDDLHDALVGRLGEDAGLAAHAEFASAFPPAYRDAYTAQQAAEDVERIHRLDHGVEIVTALERPLGAGHGDLRFVLVQPGPPVTLSEVLPLLEHLGVAVVDERPYEIRREGRPSVWRYDIGLRVPGGGPLDDPLVRAEFCATFVALRRGDVESDGFNRLVVAGLTARQVTVLRAYARYLRQTGLPFSLGFVEDTLAAHPAVAHDLVRLFEYRFDPSVPGDERSAHQDAIAASLVSALDDVPSLDEDRILRAIFDVILATVRTNAFRPVGDVPGGGPRPVLSLKLDPARIPDLPLPRPMFEIWVYSPRVEGVHLRGGRVARGGLRWSDRREDFRTEVLGLMKAQMVKNAVIVPRGAKGGFVVKRRGLQGSALRDEGVRCYREFVAGLLDVTDNVAGGAVVPPPFVVRHDTDDAYLVVAADKGTATFSDIANEVAHSYGFWLGDAFASGGSAGYDHKAIGITARGAWESVRRHARVLGLDADRDDLTVVGIGDMSGDVFGNGMLQSSHLRLVAAFDHRHIFLDPDPDPERSFAERHRLFALPRSSWDDYDRAVLSRGGAVVPRSAKSVPLSPEVRRRLAIEAAALTPNELMSAILRAPVDVLWNGGIGTYVKCSIETQADAGDRANDALRVDGCDLRCRIVGEGGNLGFTQLGRVEYALGGGLIFTDAIDNSAGVDCSDHEVNIKILLDAQVASGDLTPKQRNELLAAMTGDVAAQVLEDNRAQTLALTIARTQSGPMSDVHARYLRSMESEGLVDRQVEFLPSEKQLSERAAVGRGLTTPEFAVLLAYTKMVNADELLGSDLPDDPFVQRELAAYFPAAVRERFASALGEHRLRREIIATRLTNSMVNRAGTSFDHRMLEETGATVADITRAHVVAAEVFELDRWWGAIDELGSTVGLDEQLAMFLDLRRMVERGVLWLLRHRRPPLDLATTIAAFAGPVGELAVGMAGALGQSVAWSVTDVAARRSALGVPAELADRSAVWPHLHTAFDIAEVAAARGRTPTETATAYWGLFDRLDLAWLWERIGALPRLDRWQSHARAAQRDDLLAALRDLTDDVLRHGDLFDPPDALVERWAAGNGRSLRRVLQVFTEIKTAGVFDLTTLSVALRQLRNVVLAAR
jgi:glutamate dehydrogenase